MKRSGEVASASDTALGVLRFVYRSVGRSLQDRDASAGPCKVNGAQRYGSGCGRRRARSPAEALSGTTICSCVELSLSVAGLRGLFVFHEPPGDLRVFAHFAE